MGAEVGSRGADTAGAGIAGGRTSGAGGVVEPLRATMTSAVIAPPARARHPAAMSGLAQPRWCRACRRKSSHGSARGCVGIAEGGSTGSGTLVSAPLATALLATGLVTAALGAASAPIRSRRERNSSIVRIWSESDSSTTTYNESLDLLGTGSAHPFPD